MAAPSTRNIVPLLPTTQSVTGAADLTGVGSSTVSGTHDAFGAAALTGNGTLTTNGTRTRFGAAALTGLGSSTVAGTRTRLGAAALTGTGSLTADGTVGDTGAAALTGNGSLSASGNHTAVGAAALQGNGTLSTNGTRTRFGFATLTGTGSLTCAGTVSRTDTAALTGTGTLSASGTAEITSAAHLTGSGTLTASFEQPATGTPPGFFPQHQARFKAQQRPKHVRASALLYGHSHMGALGMVLGPVSPAPFTGEAHLTGTSTLKASGALVGHVVATADLRFTPTISHHTGAVLSGSIFTTTTHGRNQTTGAAHLIAFGSLKASGYSQSGGLTDGQLDQELLALLL